MTVSLLPSEMPAFFKALAEEESEVVRDAVYLLLFTGARLGNVLAMRWEDLDLGRGVWVVDGGSKLRRGAAESFSAG